jgi:DNA-binding transcriptional ArsR family regulator
LGDPTRRKILSRMAQSGMTGGRLAESRGVTPAAILKRLRVLERAGPIETQKVGRVRRYTLQARPLRQMADWIAEYESPAAFSTSRQRVCVPRRTRRRAE